MRENVLLVGRESPFMETLSTRIGANDLMVHFAESAPDALALVQHEDIGVVVLSIKDLAEEAIQMLDSMKKRKPLVECITLTSPTTMGWSIEGMKRGVFADFLIPFDNENLIAKIREALVKRKARKRRRKKTLRRRLEDWMVSAAFAESGSPDTAREILKEAQKEKPSQAKEQKDEKP